MDLLCVWRFTSILGTVVVLILMSAKDRLERKKYMGVWRWESEVTARMMSRFPSRVTRYMDRRSPKKRSCQKFLSSLRKKKDHRRQTYSPLGKQR